MGEDPPGSHAKRGEEHEVRPGGFEPVSWLRRNPSCQEMGEESPPPLALSPSLRYNVVYPNFARG